MYVEESIIIDKKSSIMVYTVRKRSRCSQKEFGERFGISQPKLSRIESLKELPTEDLLREIARRYRMDIRELTGEIPMSRSF